MIYTVNAPWVEGTMSWLLANTTGKFSFGHAKDCTVWYFENGEDATAFRLRFGL